LKKSAFAAGLAGIVFLTCCRPQTVTGPAPLVTPSLQYTRSVTVKAQFWYVQSQLLDKKEYVACVSIRPKPDGTYVTAGIERIATDSATEGRAWYKDDECKKRKGIVLHSHPSWGLCELSDIDKSTFTTQSWMPFTSLVCKDEDSIYVKTFDRSVLP
jgi:hypothetical protein